MPVNLAALTAVPLGKAVARGHETKINFAGGAIDTCSVLCFCFLVANLSFFFYPFFLVGAEEGPMVRRGVKWGRVLARLRHNQISDELVLL